MTTSSENDTAVKTVLETDNEQKENLSNTNEDKNNINDDTTTTTTTKTVNNDEQKEITVNHTEDDHRSKKPFNSKVKYSSMSYHRSPYNNNNNGHPYGLSPYYYYQVAPIHEKPTPLMVIPTQPSSSTTTTTTTTADNQTSNSTAVSPSNLPPRLRQTSNSENDSTNPPTATTTTTNTRRYRSILPRGSSNYYSLYPPPPLMATPPGVLYPYQPGHIAYNIRTPDEFELLAFHQQQLMNLSATAAGPVFWSPPPPPTATAYSPYPMYEPVPYMYNTPSPMNSNNSFLNPEAAEWTPPSTDTNTSADTNLLIDDEINFPPLHANRTEESTTDQAKLSNDSSPDTTESVDNNDNTNQSAQTKTELTNSDETKNLSSKLTTISYSTVILQKPDRTKSTTQNSQQTQPQTITTKQRTQIRVIKETQTRKRQPQSNRTNFNGTKNIAPIETPKQQSNDDWIEVKSKKTKKFDRSYDPSQNSSEKIFSDEQYTKQSSLSSTAETTTTTTTCTSEDDELPKTKHITIVENKTITTTTDYNQVIVDDIHQRLNNNENLLIILRGCPGAGKSTLARSLNSGYNGQIISIDEYLFDASKLEEAHLNNRRLVSEAFKRNVSPIIIDSTNTTSWEMKPYVAMGKEAGYDILLIEPQTPWRYKPRELVKRNPHNLPLRRIKEILNRFEHNITVQSLIDQLKTNFFLPCQQQQQQQVFDQNQTDTESIDPILISKKPFENIDDSTILDDVRLCIDDMILFLTSAFYQTSLSIPLTDLSFVSSSSSPTSPSAPHSLFHRSLSRFSSSTTNQDHSFANEHLRRMPTTSYTRCFDNLTPPASTKRRKNKTKQQTSNDILLNTNNNNNNNSPQVFTEHLPVINYEVCLVEDSSDYAVIDEQELSFE